MPLIHDLEETAAARARPWTAAAPVRWLPPRPMQPKRSSPPWRYGRYVRRRISSASARLASYSRSCAVLLRLPLTAALPLVPAAAGDGEGDGDGLLLGAAADGDGCCGTLLLLGLPPSDLLRCRSRSLIFHHRREEEPLDEADEDDDAEDAVEEEDEEREAAGVANGNVVSTASSSGSGAGAGDLDRQCAPAREKGESERDLRWCPPPPPPPPRTRPRSLSPPEEASAESRELLSMDGRGSGLRRRRAERRGTGRIWPLWKSSSAEDMAAADGEGKRDEKSKSKSRPRPLPRVGLGKEAEEEGASRVVGLDGALTNGVEQALSPSPSSPPRSVEAAAAVPASAAAIAGEVVGARAGGGER
ncbi:hypothetical protein BRADI_4g10121v3 [Brachypodium distachyon]|uniref:Uncharacterized protein n=1 Tax=Brachypodium distachyon TaxID=15368 RepID=A0A2K2CLS3_BRADI|nr:hypothetical protein BRADI_4g10121v3 [Brachypodium distachyon]